MASHQMAYHAVDALLAGTKVTLLLPHGERWPAGWPKGEELDAVAEGRLYLHDPLRLLAALARVTRQRRKEA
jgi:hypothetical protein